MPKVGAKEFPYTRDGIAEAKATAQATGQQVKSKRGYRDVARAQSKRARKRGGAFGGKQAPPFQKGEDRKGDTK